MELVRQVLGMLKGRLSGKGKYLELIVLQVVHLSTLRTYAQFCTGFLAAGSALLEGTLFTRLYSYLLEQSLSEQAGPADVAEASRKGFGLGLDSYQSLRRSELGKRAARVLGMCLASGMLGKDVDTRYPAIWRRFGISDVNFDSIDVVEAVLNLTRTTWDIVQECVAAKDYAPLFNRSTAHSVDEEYAYILAHLQLYEDGLYMRKTGEHDAKYMVRVANLLSKIRAAHSRASGPERTVLSGQLARILALQTKVEAKAIADMVRIAPMAFKFYGSTACGKSSIAVHFTRDCLRIIGAPWTDEYLAFLNPAESYDNVSFNYTQAIFMDDMAQQKAGTGKSTEELMNLVRIVNTAHSGIPKAELSEKGRHFYNNKFLIATTNVEDLEAAATCNEPSAILRRFAYHIEVSVAPEYMRERASSLAGDTQLNPLAMVDVAKLVEGVSTPYQRFTIKECVPLQRPATSGTSGRRSQADAHTFVTLAGPFTYSQMMEWLRPKILEHFKSQAVYVDSMKSDMDEPLCEHGHTTKDFCEHCRDPAALARAHAERLATMGVGSLSEQAGGWDPITSFFFGAKEEHAEAPSPPVVPPAPSNQPSIRERFVVWRTIATGRLQAWRDDVGLEPKPPDDPTFVRAARTVMGGSDPLEAAFIKHPHWYMTLAFTLVPACLGSVPGLLGYLALGAGGGWTCYLTGAIWASLTVGYSAVAWAKHRIAGYTLTQLHSKMRKICTASAAVYVTVVLATLGAMVLWRKRHSEPTPLTPQVGSSAPAQASGHEQCAKLTSSSPEPTLHPVTEKECSMPVSPIPSVSSAEPEPMVENGGCESRLPAPPDRDQKANIYALRDMQAVHYVEGPARTMTREQAVSRIHRQLYVVDVHYASGVVRTTQALMVQTNIALMPAHNFFKAEDTMWSIMELVFRTTDEQRGPFFRAKVGHTTVRRLTGDMAVAFVGVGGTMADIMPFINTLPITTTIPLEEHNRVRCGEQDYEVRILRLLADPVPVTSERLNITYAGIQYEREEPTFKGLCGALHVLPGRYPIIIGMHTMGGDEPASAHRGQGCLFTRMEIEAACEVLRANGPVKVPHVDMPTTVPYAPPSLANMCDIGPLYARAELRAALEGTPILPVGTLTNQPTVRPKSVFRVTPYADLVEQTLGIPRKFGPPKNLGKRPVVRKHLEEIAEIHQLDPDVLAYAVRDTLDEHVAMVEARPDLRDALRPLTLDESLNGVRGCSSINRINLATSVGWPRTGNKRPYVMEDPTDDDPGHVTLSGEMKDEVAGLLEVYARGERANIVFKGTEKDEVVKLTKEKVRIFKASPMAFNLVTRMFFLPIMRIYASLPLETGSAVGINAYSAEWDRMYTFVKCYNPEAAIVGDWVHFDQSQAYQEIMAVFTIWITLALSLGQYSTDEITIMWGIAEDTARAYVLLHGELYINDGTNPSGGALTVYVNNMVNRLRMCHCWYGCAANAPPEERTTGPARAFTSPLELEAWGYRDHLKAQPLLPGLYGRFADYVRAMFYGDDLFAAAQGCVWFNQITMGEWFAGQGKTFTNADKLPHSTETTPWEDVTFLKRAFRWDDGTGRHMAPLAMDSIYKGLYVVRRDLPFGLADYYAEAIVGAWRELYQHGEAVYNERCQALYDLACAIGCTRYLRTGVGPPAYAFWAEDEGDPTE